MAKLIDIATFRAEARAGKKPEGGVFRISTAASTANAANPRIRRFCFSDGSVDRADDRIDPHGWETDDFLKNPVALWAHNSWEPPIGRAGNLAIENERLMGDIEFASADTYAFADTIYRLVVGKYVQAVSVGFLPIKWSFVDDKDRKYGIDFEKQELLEISVVPVPCNANALAEARAKGIDTEPMMRWAERLLDTGDSVVIPRPVLADIFKAAKSPRALKQKYLTGSRVPPAPATRAAPAAISDDEDIMPKITLETLEKLIAEAFKKAGIKPKAASGAGESDGSGGGNAVDPDDDGDNHEECVRAAHVHVKMAGALHKAAGELHKSARGLLQKAVDHFDNPEAEKASSNPEECVRSAHATLKAASDLSAEATEHHETAEDYLGKAIDNIPNPEAEKTVDDKSAAQKRIDELKAGTADLAA